MSTVSLKSAALRNRPSISHVANVLNLLEVSSSRQLHATRSLKQEPPKELTPPANTPGSQDIRDRISGRNLGSKPDERKMTPIQRAQAAAKKARDSAKMQEQKFRANLKMGGLARNSVFSDDVTEVGSEDSEKVPLLPKDTGGDISQRNFSNMARVLNPRPNARARWHRRMIIRHIRRGGRLTKEMKIARTERKHLAKSHFFKTSQKKLAPLARQIAGKSVEEAILQMRFSKKKVAQDVRQHLIQARNEAIAVKGMGVRPGSDPEAIFPDGPLVLDPSITPPGPDQTPTKTKKHGLEPHETDMFISEAWVNPGPYGREPEYRARGRVNILRPPHTSISVVLKEEKTRTRERMEKETRVIKKRLGKSMWTQLPDRKITNQSQYVLW